MALTDTEMEKALDLVLDMDLDQLKKLVPVVNDVMRLERRKEARRNAARIHEGTWVVIAKDIKPKYLGGKTGTVEAIDGDRVTVKLDCGPLNKFRNGRVTFRSAAALIPTAVQPNTEENED